MEILFSEGGERLLLLLENFALRFIKLKNRIFKPVTGIRFGAMTDKKKKHFLTETTQVENGLTRFKK